MAVEPPPSSAALAGVLFAEADYAGLGKRMAILLVDGTVLVLVLIGLLSTQDRVPPLTDRVVFWSFVATTALYLVVLEGSTIGTLGFRLTGVRILTLRGERPSWFRMTARLLLWVLGPFNPLVDLFWLGGDPQKQTLRDKLAGTIVVRRNAVPTGRGDLVYRRYNLMGMTVLFQEVRAPTTR